MELLHILTLFMAGVGAGVATGFVGASAAIIITPILVLWLGYPAYTAVGISLATDVFASLVSAGIYYRYGNIAMKRAAVLAAIAVAATVAGSLLFNAVADPIIVLGTTAGILFMAVQLIRRPLDIRIRELQKVALFRHAARYPAVYISVTGILIGLIAGAFGAGGGMMILIILTLVLGYRVIHAVGTSVLIMVGIALSGAITHFAHTGVPYQTLIWTVSGGIIGGVIASRYANIVPERKQSYIIGATILILGLFYVWRAIGLYV